MLQSKLLLIILAAVVVAAVGGGALILMQQPQQTQTTTSTQTQPTQITTASTTTTTMSTTETSTTSPSQTVTSTTQTTSVETTTQTTTSTTATTTTAEETSTTTSEAPKGKLVTFGSVLELLNTINHLKYRYDSSDGSWSTFEYTIEGEENVGGKATYKVVLTIVSSDSPDKPERGTLWISKDDGKVVKIAVETEEGTQVIEGPMAEQVGYHIESFLLAPIAHMGTAETLGLRITEAQVSAGAEAQISYSPTTYSAGGKSFKAYSIDWTYTGSNENVPVKGHMVVAELIKYEWFVVEVKETYKDGTWDQMKIEEISLS